MEQKNRETQSINNSNLSINESVTTLAGDSSDNENNTMSNNNNNDLNINTLSKLNDLNNNGKEHLSNYPNYKNDDTASVFSDMSRFTGYVSTIASSEYQLNDVLVAIIGISEYNGMPNLDGVIRDYENVIKTFSTHWKYNILFQLKNDKYIYTNDIKTLKLNENKDYKLKWNGDDIDGFVEVTRKHLVQQSHNGLIFVISSHGDRGRIMYDSDCKEYELDAIFSMYQPIGSHLIESYSETQEESNYLSQIPKIFVLDMCRGGMKSKPVQTGRKQNRQKQQQQQQRSEQQVTKTIEETQTRSSLQLQLQQKDYKEEERKNDSKSNDELMRDNIDNDKDTTTIKTEEEEEKTKKDSKSANPNINENEILTFKGVSKDVASQLAGQDSNFLKIYGTTEGHAVADGTLHGGLFLRNFCKLFKDKDFISSHYLDDIILKIREYTKREATIASNLLQFTQIVETEGTLEKKLKFFNKMDYNENINDIDTLTRKLLITNLSNSCDRICVLVELENSSEDRSSMLNSLSTDNSLDLFKKYNFITIEPHGKSYEIVKPYSDRVFVTMFKIGNSDDTGTKTTNTTENKTEVDAFNTELYDRLETKEDYLYFVDNDSLNNFVDLRLKCILNDKHYLLQSRTILATDNNNNGNTNSNSNSDSGKCKQCGVIAINNCGDYSFVCRRCKYQVCQHCCHKIVTNKYTMNRTHNNNNNNNNVETKEEEVGKNKRKNTSVLVSKSNNIHWHFDFHYDRLNLGSKIHDIDKIGKCVKCNHNGVCFCFSTINKYGMVCNSGIYKIKLKIDKIYNDPGHMHASGNMIGLTSDNFGDSWDDKNGLYDWRTDSLNWIGWSANDRKDDTKLPNGLFCGHGDSGRASNIFRVSGFKYKSRNDKYSDRLPVYRSGDIVVLLYNSDLGQLSFQLFKQKFGWFGNSNEEISSLDSYIYKLPRDLTFYWFVGHQYQPMSITILD